MEEGQPSWPYKEGWISSRIYMGKGRRPTRSGLLSRVTRANYIYFPTNPESDICILYRGGPALFVGLALFAEIPRLSYILYLVIDCRDLA